MGRKVVRLSLVLALMGALLALGPIPAAVAAPGVTVTLTDQTGAESAPLGGNRGTYSVVLTEVPTGPVTITVTPDGQVTRDKATLTFTVAGPTQMGHPADGDGHARQRRPCRGQPPHRHGHPLPRPAAGYDAVADRRYTIAIADNDANLHFLP